MYVKILFNVLNIVKMALVKHVAHVGENTKTNSNLIFIINTSLNIAISVLRYVTP